MAHYARPILALVLTLALSVGPLAFALPGETTSLEGRVFLSDLKTPAGTLDVQVIPAGSEKAAVVGETDSKGHFALSEVPRGDMLLVLLDEAGKPVGASRINTKVGPTQPLTLALAPANTEEEDDDDERGGFWKWVSTPAGATIALLVVGAGTAVLVDDLLDDEETVEDLDPISESEPR